MAAATVAAPQYSYEPPAEPSSLYEIPAQSVDQPDKEYLPPLDAQPQNIVPNVVTLVSKASKFNPEATPTRTSILPLCVIRFNTHYNPRYMCTASVLSSNH